MKRQFWSKSRKLVLIIAAILALPIIYLASITSIHLHNARFEQAYDDLRDAAQSNGLLVHHFNRPQSPAGFNRFYDESKTYRIPEGLTLKMIGYANDHGEIVLPAIYNGGADHFYEGFANVRNSQSQLGYIYPDGSWAFNVNADYADAFFNGRARIRIELPSKLITPQIFAGFIDTQGQIIAETKYYGVKDFIGERNNKFTLVWKYTPYHSIYETMMDGIDISIPPIAWLFPPTKAQFIDLDGNKATITDIRRSTRKLQADAHADQ